MYQSPHEDSYWDRAHAVIAELIEQVRDIQDPQYHSLLKLIHYHTIGYTRTKTINLNVYINEMNSIMQDMQDDGFDININVHCLGSNDIMARVIRATMLPHRNVKPNKQINEQIVETLSIWDSYLLHFALPILYPFVVLAKRFDKLDNATLYEIAICIMYISTSALSLTYVADAGNPAKTVFATFRIHKDRPCNCMCSTLIFLGVAECLGLFPSEFEAVAVPSHIFVRTTKSQTVIETTRCTNANSRFYDVYTDETSASLYPIKTPEGLVATGMSYMTPGASEIDESDYPIMSDEALDEVLRVTHKDIEKATSGDTDKFRLKEYLKLMQQIVTVYRKETATNLKSDVIYLQRGASIIDEYMVTFSKYFLVESDSTARQISHICDSFYEFYAAFDVMKPRITTYESMKEVAFLNVPDSAKRNVHELYYNQSIICKHTQEIDKVWNVIFKMYFSWIDKLEIDSNYHGRAKYHILHSVISIMYVFVLILSCHATLKIDILGDKSQLLIYLRKFTKLFESYLPWMKSKYPGKLATLRGLVEKSVSKNNVGLLLKLTQILY